MKGMSIFRKTGLLALALFGVISVLTSALAAHTLYKHMTAEFLSKGAAIARSVAGSSQEILLDREAAAIQAMIDQYLEIEGVAYVFVMDGEGAIVAHTFVPGVPTALSSLSFAKREQLVTELTLDGVGRVIDISEPVLAGVAGCVHVGMNKDLIVLYFWDTVLEMQGLMLVILLVCVVVLFAVIRRISRPLRQLTEYARRLGARDFSATLPFDSDDELGVLGRTLRAMARELAGLFADMESQVLRATDDLRENTAYLTAIIDNLADGLLVVSPAGAVSVINPTMREFFGLDVRDVVGAPLDGLFPREVVELASAVRCCDIDTQEADIPLSGGRVGKAVGSSILVRAQGERCLGGVLLVRDVTRARELDRLKTDFISTVSHELRTPMTSVLGFAKIIRKRLEQAVFPALAREGAERRAADQVRENLDIIVFEAQRLTELINDVLDIAKMEAGKLQWRDQLVSMDDVIRQALNSTRGLWGLKGIAMAVDVQDGLPPVRGDRSRLVQVLVNLISNAVKFTDRGTVTCRALQEGDFIVVSVEDPGVGIPGEFLEDIFEKFKQVGDTLTAKPTGTGLGLPICRQIVEHHGGAVWAESEPGKGSTFFFSIPVSVHGETAGDDDGAECDALLPAPGSAMLVREGGDAQGGPLILVVDDDPVLARFLTQVFEGDGFRVRVASSGEGAVELARDLMPGLITMDLMMPGMDGRSAIRCLRRNPFTRHIPILVLSALSDGFSAGGDVALTKPVDDIRLLEVAHSLLSEKDIRRSCLFLGEEGDGALEHCSAVNPEDVTFTSLGGIWSQVDAGFKGTVFLPAEAEAKVDIRRLAAVPGVSVVVLPEPPGWSRRKQGGE
ncbi:MAG: ATP-binding protein [Pseudodesulfovibrio sp.]